MKLTLFILLLSFTAVFGQIVYQDLITRFVVDDFTNGANTHSVDITLSTDVTATDPDVVADDSFDAGTGCSGLVGCERDMSLTVILGLQGRSFSSDIFTSPASYYFDAEWAISNPKNSESETLLQYDGRDGSIDLDISGLGSVDLTVGGSVEFLRISAVSDLDTTYVFTAYSPNGNTCEADLDVFQAVGSYDYYESFVFFDIDDFSGNCDLTNVGAIEVSLFSNDALDAIVRQIAFVGEGVPSNTPTPSAPPPGGFTWYTFDDDDNYRSSCDEERPRPNYFMHNDNIIYYYFHEVIYYESSSSASILSAGVAFIIGLLFI